MYRFALLLLTVTVAHASVSVSRTSDDAPHPSTMELEVTLPETNQKVLIPLERTDAFENIPMTVVENGVSRTFSSHQVHHESHSHYRDIESRSVISVRHVNGKRQISGHVTHEGTSYFLEPVGDSEHRVVKNEVSHPVAMANQMQVRMRGNRWKRQTSTSPTKNVVELYLLLDSTVLAAFVKTFGSETTALTELHLYYTHILNGIDTSYRNMGTPSISVSCIGITIAKTAADDAWMSTTSLEGDAILTAMSKYIVGKTADHYMAFTRKDITGGGKSDVCGMAYVGGVCQSTKVSINEDQGLQSWGTAAHELAHNLGSQHDSSGNTCDAGLLNLMAPSSGFYTSENIGNSYQFSACSKNYVSKYIDSLGSGSCMLSAQGTRVTQLAQNQPEGGRMSLDRVCQLSYPDGPGKFFVGDDVQDKPASICAAIYCLTAAGGGTSSGGLRAPVGTPCGSQKSCDWKGQCSADPAAPVADESCFWGDSWAAKECTDWKAAIINKWDSCSADVKKACCKTLAGVQECNGV